MCSVEIISVDVAGTARYDPVMLNFFLDQFGYLALFIPVAILVYQSVVVVGGNEIALIERRWFGHKMPQGRVVALGNESVGRPSDQM